ncbi:hypothetical protein GQ457_11G033190 [Hibiscus cannabinus]
MNLAGQVLALHFPFWQWDADNRSERAVVDPSVGQVVQWLHLLGQAIPAHLLAVDRYSCCRSLDLVSFFCVVFVGFDNLLELDDKGDVSTRDNGSGLGRFSWLIQTSAERLAELLAYV